jgi:hypothetical protein
VKLKDRCERKASSEVLNHDSMAESAYIDNLIEEAEGVIS